MKYCNFSRGMAALLNPNRPVLAQIVVTRRCNLDCRYCNEYDQASQTVKTDQLERRIDHLAGLGTVIITFTGGEPLLHPDLDRLIARAVSSRMVCTIITNGFLLNQRWIECLNQAGLEAMQLSIDSLKPNDSSIKSFSLLEKKLLLLKEQACFRVNINMVLGSTTAEDTRELAKRVRDLGFYMTIGLMHRGRKLDPGLLEQPEFKDLFNEISAGRRRSWYHLFGEGWEQEMIKTGQSNWKCRAGGRFLYVDEQGLVSYCSQRRGYPGIPLMEYGPGQIKRHGVIRKGCEPGCTLACVRRASSLDKLRF